MFSCARAPGFTDFPTFELYFYSLTSRAAEVHSGDQVYLEQVYLVTALVPSDTTCLACSSGSRRLTEV